MLFKIIAANGSEGSPKDPQEELRKLNNALQSLRSGLPQNWFKEQHVKSILNVINNSVQALTGVRLGLSDLNIVRPNPNFTLRMDQSVSGCLASWHAVDRFVRHQMDEPKTNRNFEIGYLSKSNENLPFKPDENDREIMASIYEASLDAYITKMSAIKLGKTFPLLMPENISNLIQVTLDSNQTRDNLKDPQNRAIFDGYIAKLLFQEIHQALPTALRWERFTHVNDKDAYYDVLMLSDKEPKGENTKAWLNVVNPQEFLIRLKKLNDSDISNEGEMAQQGVLDLLWLTSLSVEEIQQVTDGPSQTNSADTDNRTAPSHNVPSRPRGQSFP